MIVNSILVLSILGALGICFGAGAFAGLCWLWLLPAAFLGLFLGLLILAFLFLVAVVAPLNPDRQWEQDSPFYRTIAGLYIEAMVQLLGVRIETEGLEKIPKQGRFLLVCNHLHEADPALLLHCFKKSQLAFISKRENRDMFVVGKLMPRLLCQLVNRENDRDALRTIIKCIQLLRDDKVSVAVFPEGYIHAQRKFQPFRAGVFKIAQKANVPIVVCTVHNTHKIIKNALKLKRTTVKLHLLEVIPAEALAGRTTVQIAGEIHDKMALDLGDEYRLPEPPEENT